MSSPRPIASTVEDALAYAGRQPLPRGVAFAPLAALDAGDALHDAEPPPPFVITAIATGPVAMADAVAVWRTFRDRREESGLTPVIVDADAWEHLRAYRDEWAWPDAVSLAVDAAGVEAEEPTEFFARYGGGPEFEAVVRDAVETLERAYGRGLARVEGVLDVEEMMALEEGGAGEEGDESADDDDEGDDDEGDDGRGDDVGVDDEDVEERVGGGGMRLTVALSGAVAPAATEEGALAVFAGGADPAHVVLLACPPHMVLYYLGFGGWNDCPPPRKHAVIWKHWGARHGAEVVRVGAASIDALVARPVATVEDLGRALHEAAAYSQDSLNEGVLPLAAVLFRSRAWSYWWD